jgi:hypothetical protein
MQGRFRRSMPDQVSATPQKWNYQPHTHNVTRMQVSRALMQCYQHFPFTLSDWLRLGYHQFHLSRARRNHFGMESSACTAKLRQIMRAQAHAF